MIGRLEAEAAKQREGRLLDHRVGGRRAAAQARERGAIALLDLPPLVGGLEIAPPGPSPFRDLGRRERVAHAALLPLRLLSGGGRPSSA